MTISSANAAIVVVRAIATIVERVIIRSVTVIVIAIDSSTSSDSGSALNSSRRGNSNRNSNSNIDGMLLVTAIGQTIAVVNVKSSSKRAKSTVML